ncbi:MAG TPA: hypothetical protein ENN95_02050, partial [Deltaproteobacteria bacterium]|nr:hypothetical protein [Deltaproteobacteria bacterium]
EYICYYKNGQIKEKGCFVNDKRHGEYVSYLKNGQIKEKAFYQNGNLVGSFFSCSNEVNDSKLLDEEKTEKVWQEKDIADLLKDLANFDKVEK